MTERTERVDEKAGGDLLAACFERAGLQVTRDAPFDEDGVKVVLDGWDPARRIGFEFITTEAGDRAEFTPEVIAALETRMRAEELFLFLVDEADIASAGDLVAAAEGFLAVLRDRGKLP